MRRDYRYFDVFPRLVRAGDEATLTIRPLFDHCRFAQDRLYRVAIIPLEGVAHQTTWVNPEDISLSPSDGLLRVHSLFESEQEYVVRVGRVDGDQVTHLAEFRVYALEDDLLGRRPYKGDMHAHSAYSDGKESPAYVAAASRRIGLDFMAVTDHQQYAPSLEAIRAFAGVESDLKIYPGEEVHPPGNPVHIVNFGGRFSLNEQFGSQAYHDEVRAIEASLTDLPPAMERYPYASCVWCFDKIRAAGGLGVFCHPYWISRHRYDVPGALTRLVFERQPFDALELIGGFHRSEVESNALQVARYHEERARGKRIPIVGVSDAHGCEQAELFGWYYTIVFAPALNLPDLIRSVKELYSVAVEALPGETVRAFGPLRLVKYAQFLLREVLPQHDELCAEEGRLMLAHLAGDGRAAELLSLLKGRTAALADHLWDNDHAGEETRT